MPVKLPISCQGQPDLEVLVDDDVPALLGNLGIGYTRAGGKPVPYVYLSAHERPPLKRWLLGGALQYMQQVANINGDSLDCRRANLRVRNQHRPVRPTTAQPPPLSRRAAPTATQDGAAIEIRRVAEHAFHLHPHASPHGAPIEVAHNLALNAQGELTHEFRLRWVVTEQTQAVESWPEVLRVAFAWVRENGSTKS